MNYMPRYFDAVLREADETDGRPEPPAVPVNGTGISGHGPGPDRVPAPGAARPSRKGGAGVGRREKVGKEPEAKPEAGPFYRFLNADGTGCRIGRDVWPLPAGNGPGPWLATGMAGNPRGGAYHLYRGADLVFWLGPVLFAVEPRGRLVAADTDVVAEDARILRRVDAWNPETAVRFAADCAQRVLPLFELAYPDDDRPRRAIEAARTGLFAAPAAAGALSAAAMTVAEAADLLRGTDEHGEDRADAHSGSRTAGNRGGPSDAEADDEGDTAGAAADRQPRHAQSAAAAPAILDPRTMIALRAARSAIRAVAAAAQAAAAAAEAAGAAHQAAAVPTSGLLLARTARAVAKAAAKAADADANARAARSADVWDAWAPAWTPGNKERRWQTSHLLRLIRE